VIFPVAMAVGSAGRIRSLCLPRCHRPASSKEGVMEGNEPPRGALLFILVFLVVIVVFWFNTYMRLWLRY